MSSAFTIQLTARIRKEALRLGFFKAGIAPVRPLPNSGRYTKWLRAGMHGQMAYLERRAPERLNPELLLEGARSVLVLALNYYSRTACSDLPLKGRIGRYAAGDDYHGIVGTRLDALLAFIRNQAAAARGRCYVDTGPVMEKVWGAQTSIGWMGKNTTLISRSHGSWFYIGIILLDIELEYDSPEEDSCGQCDRCIQACPAGAITAPYVLDARRCISYLTQMRGAIPHPLRPLMGRWIFGCDACQEACPWNRVTLEASGPDSQPGEKDLLPDLAPLVDISEGEFSRGFKKRAIHQTTRDQFVRNVVVALGNSGNIEAVPALERALQDSSPLVRSHAAWALGRLAAASVSRILRSARKKETDPTVLEEIDLATS